MHQKSPFEIKNGKILWGRAQPFPISLFGGEGHTSPHHSPFDVSASATREEILNCP